MVPQKGRYTAAAPFRCSYWLQLSAIIARKLFSAPHVRGMRAPLRSRRLMRGQQSKDGGPVDASADKVHQPSIDSGTGTGTF